MRFTVQRYSSVPSVAGSDVPVEGLRQTASAETILEGYPPPKLLKTDETRACSVTRASSPSVADSPAPSLDSEVFEPVARRGRQYAQRQRERLVQKTGECNISQTNVASKNKRFFIDIFTTAVDMQWRYNLLMFALSFLCSWLIFALAWWIICIAHGDHLKRDDPCVDEVYDFRTALLFSIETQHTIGYGSRSMMPKCPEAIIVLMLQSCIGVFIQSLMTGIIFAKLSRPKRRSQTILFSKNAVICQRDGDYCLLLRVADMRKSYIVEAIVRAIMVKNRTTKEGEVIPLCQYPLTVETESSLVDSYAFLACPCTVMHKINENSPLWDVSAEKIISEQFEIVVILEGTIESTGMTVQVRTSYLPAEILWGHRLSPLLTYQKENGQYKIDYGQFHNTIPTSMPELSAKDYKDVSESTHTAKCEDFPFNFTSQSGPSKQKRVNSVIRRVLSLKRRRGSSPSPSCYSTTMTSMSNGIMGSLMNIRNSNGADISSRKNDIKSTGSVSSVSQTKKEEPVAKNGDLHSKNSPTRKGGTSTKTDGRNEKNNKKDEAVVKCSDVTAKASPSIKSKLNQKNSNNKPNEERRRIEEVPARNGNAVATNGHAFCCPMKTLPKNLERDQDTTSLPDRGIALA